MFELYFDKRGEVAMEDCQDLFDKFPQWADRAIKSAFSSEGNRVKKVVRLAIQKGGLHGEWLKQNPNTNYFSRMHRQHWSRKRNKDYQTSLAGELGLPKRKKKNWEDQWFKNYRLSWKGERGEKTRTRQFKLITAGQIPYRLALQKMAGAVRYKYHKDIQLVRIGFMDNPKLEEWMRHQAGGYRMAITPRMRRLAFAMGMPLAKGKNEIVIPPRPVITPVFVAEEAKIRRNIQVKIYRSIARYVTGTEKRDWPE